MTVRTTVHEALDRIDPERERVSGELAALDRFDAAVRDIDPVSPTEAVGPISAGTGGAVSTVSATQRSTGEGERTARVRTRFAETVEPYGDSRANGSEALVETMAAKLGDEIAASLAPSTPGRFTPQLKTAIRSAVEQRRAELRAMDRALDAEAESLTAALGDLEPIVDWLATADETPLPDLGFEALRARHETLAAHRERCRTTVDERQDLLHGTTNYNATVGLAHRSFVEHLYRDLPTVYPVLSTVIRLESACRECQRHVRDHLSRRV